MANPSMIDQNVFNLVATVCGALGGWWLKVIWENLKALEKMDHEILKELAQVRLNVASNYVPKDQFELRMDRIFEKLDRIEEKIDRKADKRHHDEPL